MRRTAALVEPPRVVGFEVAVMERWAWVSAVLLSVWYLSRVTEKRDDMIKGFKWVRPVTIERWVDGDTVIGLIDRGDGDYYRPKKGIRLLKGDGTKFDAPEVKDEPERAEAARLASVSLAPVGSILVSTSHELDVYGRPLCSIQLADGRDLATVLIEMGHSK